MKTIQRFLTGMLLASMSHMSVAQSNAVVNADASTGNAYETNFSLGQVYPNPVLNHFSLQVTSLTEADATLKLVDMLGQTVIQKQVGLSPGINNFTIDMEGMAKGIYEIVLHSGAKGLTRKVVKAG